MKEVFLLSLIASLTGCSGDKANAKSPAESDSFKLLCTANYQGDGAGTAVESKELATVTEEEGATKLAVAMKGYAYDVTWDRSLTSVYMTISKNKKTVAFSTSRVPSDDHNDSMLDITLPTGPRLYLGCDFAEYRP